MTLSQNIQSKTKSPNAPLTKQDLRPVMLGRKQTIRSIQEGFQNTYST